MPYRVLLPVLMCCIAAGPATKPLFPGVTTRPGTQPASAPARVRDGLLGGSVRFLVPSQWRLFDRKEDQTQVFYHPSPEVGTVSVMVTPQGSVIRGNDPATRQRVDRRRRRGDAGLRRLSPGRHRRDHRADAGLCHRHGAGDAERDCRGDGAGAAHGGVRLVIDRLPPDCRRQPGRLPARGVVQPHRRADGSIEKYSIGFFNFSCIASGCYIPKTSVDEGEHAEHAADSQDDIVDNCLSQIIKVVTYGEGIIENNLNLDRGITPASRRVTSDWRG